VNQANARKQPFVLHKEAFECLLHALHPDREGSSLEYERLRARLVRFFTWQGAAEPENLADASIDRLAMKLYRGEQILDLRNYLHGIARMVLREERNQTQRRESLLDKALPFLTEAAPASDGEELYQALEASLARLPAEQRRMILEYYAAPTHSEQVATRLRMAAEFGISANALRNRVLRLRVELEQSTLRKMSQPKKVGDKPSPSRTYW